ATMETALAPEQDQVSSQGPPPAADSEETPVPWTESWSTTPSIWETAPAACENLASSENLNPVMQSEPALVHENSTSSTLEPENTAPVAANLILVTPPRRRPVRLRSEQRRSGPGLLWPLVWLNRGFDQT